MRGWGETIFRAQKTIFPVWFSYPTIAIWRRASESRKLSEEESLVLLSTLPGLYLQGSVGGVTPQAQSLSAQDQIWHFCWHISKLVIYIGKMQRFLCLSAKSYVPVLLACKLKTYRQNSYVMLWSNVSACKRFVYNSRPMLIGILITMCNVWATIAFCSFDSFHICTMSGATDSSS